MRSKYIVYSNGSVMRTLFRTECYEDSDKHVTTYVPGRTKWALVGIIKELYQEH